MRKDSLSFACLNRIGEVLALLCIAMAVGCSVEQPSRFSLCAVPICGAASDQGDEASHYLTMVGLRFGERSAPFEAPPIELAESTFRLSLVNLTEETASVPWEAFLQFFTSIQLTAADGLVYELVRSSRPCRGPGFWGILPSIETGDRYIIDNGWTREYSWCINRGRADMQYKYPPKGPGVFRASVPSVRATRGNGAAVQRVQYELCVP